MAESISKANPNVEKISFQTLDRAIIPKNELLRNRNNIPFVMVLERKGSQVSQKYAINLNQSFKITNQNESKSGEEKYLEYCLGIGLPSYHSFMLANFASKLHQTLPKHHHFTAATILQGLSHTLSYFRSTTDESAASNGHE